MSVLDLHDRAPGAFVTPNAAVHEHLSSSFAQKREPNRKAATSVSGVWSSLT
jgi:hypothetical protein